MARSSTLSGKLLNLVPIGFLQRASYFDVLKLIEGYQSERGHMVKLYSTQDSTEKDNDDMLISFANVTSDLLIWSEQNKGIKSPDKATLSTYLEEIKPIVSTLNDRVDRYAALAKEEKSFLNRARIYYRYLKETSPVFRNLREIRRETSKNLVEIANKAQ